MNSLVRAASIAALYSSLTLLSACTTKVPGLSSSAKPVNACALSGTQNLEFAVDEAQTLLASGCEKQFNGYFDQLLSVAAGYPREENAAVFQNFLRWSVNTGIVSKVQAGDRYNRYFTTSFNGLNDSQSVASSVCPNLEETLSGLRDELGEKKTGLQDIMANAEKYQRSTRLYYDLELNLHAICAAVES